MSASSSVKQRSCHICLNESDSQTKDTRGTNICGGCEVRFCNRHYKEHRVDIDKEFQKLVEEHDLLIEQVNTIASVDSVTSSLIDEINRWEIETIDKVRLVAISVRENITKLIKQDEEMVKNQMKNLTDELKEKESEHEYDEIDVEEIKSKLNQLQQQIRNLSNEKIDITYQAIEWETMVIFTKEHNQQLDCHPLPIKQYFYDTTILTVDQQLILNEFYETSNQEWTLLYKATRDGFNPNDFHRYCDRKVPTMTIYQENTSHYLFGGFTRLDWTPQHSSSPKPQDPQAFLFTLANPHSLAPTKFPIRHNKAAAVYCHGDFGPSFGFKESYSDIYYNKDRECHVYFPRSFTDTTGLDHGSKIFTGTDSFGLSEIEVFTLLSNQST